VLVMSRRIARGQDAGKRRGELFAKRIFDDSPCQSNSPEKGMTSCGFRHRQGAGRTMEAAETDR
jgi:hypothetical protein